MANERYKLRNRESGEEIGPFSLAVEELLEIDKYEIMHSTGLFDQAKQEIYTGDFIVRENSRPALVEHSGAKIGFEADCVFVELTQDLAQFYRRLG